MNQQEAVNVVTYLNRAGLLWAMEGQAAVWADALWDVSFVDAQAACRDLVREGTASGRPATPADLRRHVRKVRSARIAGRVPPAPPEPLEWSKERAYAKTYLRALGDGATEEEADAAACALFGLVRTAIEAKPGRLRELLAELPGKE